MEQYFVDIISTSKKTGSFAIKNPLSNEKWQEIAKLKDLKKLYISKSDFSNLPDGLLKFPKLERLILESNNITEVPGFLINSGNLSELSISNNPIKDFSILKHLPHLRRLGLKGCKLKSIC